MKYVDDAARWGAVVSRERAAEGAFYYAVRTTGIYCRPTCPARRPKREHVTFFDTPDAAAAAGFRACRRCQPESVTEQAQAVALVQRLLDQAQVSVPTLAELGRAVGFSPFHLQRTFKRATGLSPRQYVAARRAARLREALREGQTVTEAGYSAGYGSSRALYENAKEELGMAPTKYRRGGEGERIAYDVVDSPLGRLLVAATQRGVCAVRFGDTGDDRALIDEVEREFPQAALERDSDAVAGYVVAVLDHVSAKRQALDLPVDAEATAFQRRVWEALRQIPYGETRSYTQVAEMIGAPTAARAVARACATNPVALVVPCHRVVGAGGGLAGYRWGLQRKRALLERERGSQRLFSEP